jgi:hypothetical protein
MLKTILILPNGTEISSGRDSINAIQRLNTKESVNDFDDLIFGSVCSKMIEVKIITPQNELYCNAGDEIKLSQENQQGTITKVGHFISEKPTKVGANTTKIVAYDKITKLDKDLTEWFNSLSNFPYTLIEFAKMVCQECGLSLSNTTIPNEEILVNKFEANGTTGRQFMRWIGEACGCYCIANENGNVKFSWYNENTKPIVSKITEGATTFFGGGLDYEDYSTKVIDRIKIRKDEKDVGLSFPTEESGENVYIIEANPILNGLDENALIGVLEILYPRIGNISYTPCEVQIPATNDYNVGDIISITDANNVTFSSIVMHKNQSGQSMTLRCTGNYFRNGAVTLYDTSYRTNYGKTFTIQQDVNGLKIRNEQTEKGLSELNFNVDGISARVENAEGDVSELKQAAEGFSTVVGNIQNEVSEIKQTAGQVRVVVSDEGGKLSSIINPEEISITRLDADGNVASGFFYDADAGEFKFYGAGEFRSSTGSGYCVRVEGNEIILYGNGLAKIRIGVQNGTDPNGMGSVDYPYIIMGATASGSVGLMKKFYNGMWYGNSVPKDATGNFNGMSGASGLFVNTQENKAYVVAGTEMQNIYTGEAVARFA